MKAKMKRPFLMVLFLGVVAVLTAPASLRAQVPTPPPTPTPDPQVYTDEAMTFRAPPQFHLVARRVVPLSALGSDSPTPLAIWAWPDHDNPRSLAVLAQAYEGTVDSWEGAYEQEIRQQGDTVVFRDKTHFALKNGMPAMFMTMTAGEGFNVRKSYLVVWDDSERGMVLQLVTNLDDISEDQAKAWLSDVSAVRYPIDR
jgi:hypothetical protein